MTLPRRWAKRREIRHQGAPRRRVGRALDDLALSQASRQLERAVCGAWVAKDSEARRCAGRAGTSAEASPRHPRGEGASPSVLYLPRPREASSSHADHARHRTSRSGGWPPSVGRSCQGACDPAALRTKRVTRKPSVSHALRISRRLPSVSAMRTQVCCPPTGRPAAGGATPPPSPSASSAWIGRRRVPSSSNQQATPPRPRPRPHGDSRPAGPQEIYRNGG